MHNFKMLATDFTFFTKFLWSKWVKTSLQASKGQPQSEGRSFALVASLDFESYPCL